MTRTTPFVLGKVTNKRGYRVRCVRFGKLAAFIERRPGEQIRHCSRMMARRFDLDERRHLLAEAIYHIDPFDAYFELAPKEEET